MTDIKILQAVLTGAVGVDAHQRVVVNGGIGDADVVQPTAGGIDEDVDSVLIESADIDIVDMDVGAGGVVEVVFDLDSVAGRGLRIQTDDYEILDIGVLGIEDIDSAAGIDGE